MNFLSWLMGHRRGNCTLARRGVPAKARECVQVSYHERRFVGTLKRAIAQPFERVRLLKTAVAFCSDS